MGKLTQISQMTQIFKKQTGILYEHGYHGWTRIQNPISFFSFFLAECKKNAIFAVRKHKSVVR